MEESKLLQYYRKCEVLSKLISNIHMGKAGEINDIFCKDRILYELDYEDLEYTVYCNQIQQGGPLFYAVLVKDLYKTIVNSKAVENVKYMPYSIVEINNLSASDGIQMVIFDKDAFSTPGIGNYSMMVRTMVSLSEPGYQSVYTYTHSDTLINTTIAAFYACNAYIGMENNNFDKVISEYISKVTEDEKESKDLSSMILSVFNKLFDYNRYYTDIQHSLMRILREESKPGDNILGKIQWLMAKIASTNVKAYFAEE